MMRIGCGAAFSTRTKPRRPSRGYRRDNPGPRRSATIAVVAPSHPPDPHRPADLLVRSRRILTSSGWLDGAVHVQDGKIVALTAAGNPNEAPGSTPARVLDLGDKV